MSRCLRIPTLLLSMPSVLLSNQRILPLHDGCVGSVRRYYFHFTLLYCYCILPTSPTNFRHNVGGRVPFERILPDSSLVQLWPSGNVLLNGIVVTSRFDKNPLDVYCPQVTPCAATQLLEMVCLARCFRQSMRATVWLLGADMRFEPSDTVPDLECDVIVGHEWQWISLCYRIVAADLRYPAGDSHFTPELTFVGQCAPSCETL